MAHEIYSLGAGGWVVRGDGRVLLVRMTYGPANGRLMIPSGNVEPDELAADAAAREVLEETGVETVVRELILVRQRTVDAARNLYLVFHLQPVGGQETPQLAEVSELVWLSPDEILARDDVQPIAAELAAVWRQSPGSGLAPRRLGWQHPATYAVWAGEPGQPSAT